MSFPSIDLDVLDTVTGGAAVGDVIGAVKNDDAKGPIGAVAGLMPITNHAYAGALVDLKNNSGTVAPIQAVARPKAAAQ